MSSDNNNNDNNNNNNNKLEEIRRLHASRFRDSRAPATSPRTQNIVEQTTTVTDDDVLESNAQERPSQQLQQERRAMRTEGQSGVRGIPGAVAIGVAMAHARHMFGQHQQQLQRHVEQQQQQQQRQRERETTTTEDNEGDDDDDDDGDENNDLQAIDELAEEEILAKPLYLTSAGDDFALAQECSRTGKAPDELLQDYLDEVMAIRMQMKENRREQNRRTRRRVDEVNERASDSMRRRAMRFEVQIGGPEGPIFRSVQYGGPNTGGAGGVDGANAQTQQAAVEGMIGNDPFLVMIREVIGARAQGETREAVLNDTGDRFERAFRNMFHQMEQTHSGSMGVPPQAPPPPGFGDIRGFGDLLNAMHGFASFHTHGDENLAEAPLTQQEINAMPKGTANGNEGNNGSSCASCSVCLSDIERGENIKKLSCGHSYHCECIDTWLLRSRVCPSCRHDCTKAPKPQDNEEQLRQLRRQDMD